MRVVLHLFYNYLPFKYWIENACPLKTFFFAKNVKRLCVCITYIDLVEYYARRFSLTFTLAIKPEKEKKWSRKRQIKKFVSVRNDLSCEQCNDNDVWCVACVFHYISETVTEVHIWIVQYYIVLFEQDGGERGARTTMNLFLMALLWRILWKFILLAPASNYHSNSLFRPILRLFVLRVILCVKFVFFSYRFVCVVENVSKPIIYCVYKTCILFLHIYVALLLAHNHHQNHRDHHDHLKNSMENAYLQH